MRASLFLFSFSCARLRFRFGVSEHDPAGIIFSAETSSLRYSFLMKVYRVCIGVLKYIQKMSEGMDNKLACKGTRDF